MLIPSWCIGPDGTVLWPIESDCGCIAEKSLRGIVGDSRNTSYLPVVIQSCKKHFETVVRIAAEDNGPYAPGANLNPRVKIFNCVKSYCNFVIE